MNERHISDRELSEQEYRAIESRRLVELERSRVRPCDRPGCSMPASFWRVQRSDIEYVCSGHADSGGLFPLADKRGNQT